MAKKLRKVLRFGSDKKLEVFEEEETPKEDNSRSKFYIMISLVTELGLSISLPIAGGAILGQYLDNKFGTSPRITLSLIFFGLFIGSANIYFIIKENSKST